MFIETDKLSWLGTAPKIEMILAAIHNFVAILNRKELVQINTYINRKEFIF